MKTTAIIAAAGRSARLPGAVPKQFRPVAGRPVLAHTLKKFDLCPDITDVIVVVAEDYLLYTSDAVVDRYEISKVRKIVPGKETRFESIAAVLESLPASCEIVVIHDGVRPMVRPEVISRGIAVCRDESAVVCALRATDAVKRVENNYILATLDKERMYLAQTPQFFERELILNSYRKIAASGVTFSDDSYVVEAAGYKVRIIDGDEANMKITTPRDLELMRFLLASEAEESNAGV
ncbi:MAG: 2-C-methyl-D-erythritol 4-phosphate cytidylyltransferase [candidate division Zixibacteria bacterium]|nr:2-C-methyl-D-erythritol 4-phosphate cytidylyltransferase [candidate division Zixibacteria bacterium]MBU1471952.1 2-C-methyl-D-erythritol 4-phosphate cytidylyltransferase [candidate division Zixibacteria bacterium]MBU2626211.1 2-C-methyl-D-erythritol 4-phosphate cytidylyltransferase [candidate division Zixibacteria bacterium]